MRRHAATLAIWVFIAFAPSQARTQEETNDLKAVAQRIETLVEKDFYRKVDFPTLGEDVNAHRIDQALHALGASHTRRIPKDTIDYFEIFDIYNRSLAKEIPRLFHSQRDVSYRGIGIAPRIIDGKTFVADVYGGSPAARAGIRVGDEIVAVNGKPYQQIDSFADPALATAKLNLRRAAEGPTFDAPVEVKTIRPDDAFRAATNDSIRVIQQGNRRIGYVRLWTMHDYEVHDAVQKELGAGRLKDVDVLIVDLRGRWGGYVGRLADVFSPRGSQIEFIDRDGRASFAPLRWRKPVVGIIDEGSRSAMEILAYVMKKNGAQLVGTRTAGAVLGGEVSMLPDDSLLMLAASQVLVDGELLEGKGVSPDVAIPYPLAYSDGADPQFDAALKAATELLGP